MEHVRKAFRWLWDKNDDEVTVDHGRRKFVFVGAAAGLVATVAPSLLLKPPTDLPISWEGGMEVGGRYLGYEVLNIPSLNELITETMRQHAATFSDNVRANNRLWRRLRGEA